MPFNTTFSEPERRIVSRVYREGPLSKQQIADLTGMSWGSVVKFVSLLEEKGILQTKGTVDRPRQKGKNAYVYGFTGRYPHAIGVDVEYTTTRVIVTNLNRRVLLERSFATVPLDDFERIAEFLASAIGSVLADCKEASSILGVGIGIPGVGVPVVAVPGGRSNKTLLEAHLEQLLRYPVKVAQNTQAYTMFERWFRQGFAGDDFLFVSIRSGIGAGLFLNGQLYPGLHDLAGAFGHVVVDRDGIPCRCGKRGCLETVINEHALRDRYATAVGEPVEEVSRLFVDADNGKEGAQETVAYLAHHLGEAIGNALLVLNISQVIVSAHFGDSFAYFRDELEREIRRHMLPVQTLKLEVAPLDRQGFTQGAALLVFNRVLG